MQCRTCKRRTCAPNCNRYLYRKAKRDRLRKQKQREEQILRRAKTIAEGVVLMTPCTVTKERRRLILDRISEVCPSIKPRERRQIAREALGA